MPVVPQVPFFIISVILISKGSPTIEKKIKSTYIYKKYLYKINDKIDLELVKRVTPIVIVFIVIAICAIVAFLFI